MPKNLSVGYLKLIKIFYLLFCSIYLRPCSALWHRRQQTWTV